MVSKFESIFAAAKCGDSSAVTQVLARGDVDIESKDEVSSNIRAFQAQTAICHFIPSSAAHMATERPHCSDVCGLGGTYRRDSNSLECERKHSQH